MTENRGIPTSTLHPHFLHTNSTSHKWPFSAIAELIDNGFDAKAKKFWIDKQIFNGHSCLIFMDNGAGMNFKGMHEMLSFGYSSKQRWGTHVPVGQYGNGFKSSSMRLGKDAIVFSRRGDIMCVGLLSQTYLEDIKAENVIVPIITFTPTEQTFNVAPEQEASLQAILKYSPFNTKEQLLNELSVIGDPQSTGTRIIIWNLRHTNSALELDFSEDFDIRIPDDAYDGCTEERKWQGSVPESEYSLQAYCRILYQIPKMQIIIRGEKVKTFKCVSKSLEHIYKDSYKPRCINHSIEIIFGYNTKNKDHYGIMMYHHNRLIKAYEPVACQRKADRTGVGVIGIIQCDYLNPTHNKQDFIPTDEYRKTMAILNTKLKDYCTKHAVKDSVECQDLSDVKTRKEILSVVKTIQRKKKAPIKDTIVKKTLKVPTRFESITVAPSASEACSSKNINITDSEDNEAAMQEDDISVSSGKSLDHELQFQQVKEETNQLQHEQEQMNEQTSNLEDENCMLSCESSETYFGEHKNLNGGQKDNDFQACRTRLNELSQHVGQVLSDLIAPLNNQIESHQNLSEGVQKKQNPSSPIPQTAADVKSPSITENKKPKMTTSSSADPSASEACSININIADREDDEAVKQEDDNNSGHNQLNKSNNTGGSEKSQDHELQFQHELQDKKTNQLQHEQEQLDEKNPSSSNAQTVTDVKNSRKNKGQSIDIIENKKPKVTTGEDDEAVMQEDYNNSGNNQMNKDNNSKDSEKSQDHELQFQQDKEQPNQLQHEQEQLDEKMNSVEYDHSMVSSQKNLESDCSQGEHLNEGQENNNLQACMNGLNELRQHVVMVLSNFIPPLNNQQINRVCGAINEICREVTDGTMAST